MTRNLINRTKQQLRAAISPPPPNQRKESSHLGDTHWETQIMGKDYCWVDSPLKYLFSPLLERQMELFLAVSGEVWILEFASYEDLGPVLRQLATIYQVFLLNHPPLCICFGLGYVTNKRAFFIPFAWKPTWSWASRSSHRNIYCFMSAFIGPYNVLVTDLFFLWHIPYDFHTRTAVWNVI